MSNATRFIGAYNNLDMAVRRRYNLKANITFSEVIRIGAGKNSVIRKYEEDLMDYGRLRNAIVHKSNSEIVIAEPHLSVVENLEKILEHVLKPPKAINTVAKQAVTLRHDTIIAAAISLMARSNFSNVPVVSGSQILGVLNNKLIVEAISNRLEDTADFLSTANVASVLKNGDHYLIAKSDITIDIVLEHFSANPKLMIVILTNTGCDIGDIVGVITTGDIIKMNNLLD